MLVDHKIHRLSLSAGVVSLVILAINNYSGESFSFGSTLYYPGIFPLDIIAIEGNDNEFFVITDDHYYSTNDDRLSKLGWDSIAVNGKQVFVNTVLNKTFTTNLDLLTDTQRDLVRDIRRSYLSNLSGLGPTLQDSGSSSSYGPSYTKNNNYNGNSYANNYYGRYPLAGSSLAARAANSDADFAKLASGSSGSTSSSGVSGSQLLGDYNRKQTYYGTPVAYNYYNLCHYPEVNNTLTGDVYSFSLSGYIVDVFSQTVLVNQRAGQSIIYRDHRYFSYAQQYMPLGINRFFLSESTVIFVYNDGTLLAKNAWMLNPIELELVIAARSRIKELLLRLESSVVLDPSSLTSVVTSVVGIVSGALPTVLPTINPLTQSDFSLVSAQ